MKWEYTYCILHNTSRERPIVLESLNDYGKSGWELVSVDNGIAYFKRISKQDAIEAEEFMQELTYSAIVNLMNKR